jgi:hypothetical protein
MHVPSKPIQLGDQQRRPIKLACRQSPFELGSIRKFVAYYRVSTNRQRKSGLGLEAQMATVSAHLNGAKPIEEFVESESGPLPVSILWFPDQKTTIRGFVG